MPLAYFTERFAHGSGDRIAVNPAAVQVLRPVGGGTNIYLSPTDCLLVAEGFDTVTIRLAAAERGEEE